VLLRCGHTMFRMTKDIVSAGPVPFDTTRYRPQSLKMMQPHEYSREESNCRLWWGNVSAAHGAWSCGQWDMDDPTTMKPFALHVRIMWNGQANLWADYREICPDFETESPN